VTDHLAAHIVGGLQGNADEADTVEMDQAILHAHPDIAVPGLGQGANGIAREPVFFIPVTVADAGKACGQGEA